MVPEIVSHGPELEYKSILKNVVFQKFHNKKLVRSPQKYKVNLQYLKRGKNNLQNSKICKKLSLYFLY